MRPHPRAGATRLAGRFGAVPTRLRSPARGPRIRLQAPLAESRADAERMVVGVAEVELAHAHGSSVGAIDDLMTRIERKLVHGIDIAG